MAKRLSALRDRPSRAIVFRPEAPAKAPTRRKKTQPCVEERVLRSLTPLERLDVAVFGQRSRILQRVMSCLKNGYMYDLTL